MTESFKNPRSPEQETRPAVAAILVTNMNYETGRLEILLAKRLTEPTGYTPPGGKIEKDETPLEAAIRELGEETDLKPNPAWFRRRQNAPFPIEHKEPYLVRFFINGKYTQNRLGQFFLYTIPIEQCYGKLINKDDKLGPWKFYTLDEAYELPSNFLRSFLVGYFNLPSHAFFDCLLIRLGYDPDEVKRRLREHEHI